MTVYGNISRIDCSQNMANITALDTRHNTYVTRLFCGFNEITDLQLGNNTVLSVLWCYNNQLSSLDVTKNTGLTKLDCYNNQISNLDVSQNPDLKELWCYNNQINSLDVSQNTALTYLICYQNQLSSLKVDKNVNLQEFSCGWNQIDSLDVSKNTALTTLYCQGNQLHSLDIAANTQLTTLWCSHNQLSSLDVRNNTTLRNVQCFDNAFDAHALDVIYCALPDRHDLPEPARIYLLDDMQDENYEIVMATNTQNAIDKNWVAKCLSGDEIPQTTGNYNCSDAIDNISLQHNISIYPNPVTDILHIDTYAKAVKVQLHNLSGALVLEKANCQNISIAHLPKGVYLLTVITAQGVYTQKVMKEN